MAALRRIWGPSRFTRLASNASGQAGALGSLATGIRMSGAAADAASAAAVTINTQIRLAGVAGAVSAATGQLTGDVTWSTNVPSITFTPGTPASHSLVQYTSGFDSSKHAFTVSTGNLDSANTGVTLNASFGYVYSGTGTGVITISILIVDTVVDDFTPRLTALGAALVYAHRMNDATKIAAQVGTIDQNNWLLANGDAFHAVFDATVKPPGSTGSLKYNVFNTDGSGAGDVGVYFGHIRTFTTGDTCWFSFRLKAPPTFCFAPWPQDVGGTQDGVKQCIFSDRFGSNSGNAIVVQTLDNRGLIGGYYYDPGGSTPRASQGSRATFYQNGDLIDQTSIDNLANPVAWMPYPLTGTDIDDGSAWDAGQQQARQWGQIFSRQNIDNVRIGLGDPLSGGFRLFPNEWITITVRLVLGTPGTNTSRYTCWGAREGKAYVKIWDAQNISRGSGPTYNTLWPLPYASHRVSGGRSVGSRTNNIGGMQIHVVGLGTPTGAGTLEYNATTKRFRWAGAAETFGVARGFSVANNILFQNIVSGTNTQSYLVIEITDQTALPQSGVVTDTITIANGRPDTQVNYADAIIATAAIPSPFGDLPVG